MDSLPLPFHRKLRVLCLHGFRTSASIFEQQIRRWDRSLLDLLDLTFLDAPFPCGGKSDVEGLFPPPYYEWFQYNIIFTEFTGLDQCFEYISKFMSEHGPFDGIIGFSQGAVLTAALAGLQQKNLLLSRHPPIRFVLIISGAMFKDKKIMKDCYSEVIKCPSVHFIGANDWLKPKNEEVRKVFENPSIIRHQAKHVVPRLDDQAVTVLRSFFSNVLEGVLHEQKKEKLTNHSEDRLLEITVGA